MLQGSSGSIFEYHAETWKKVLENLGNLRKNKKNTFRAKRSFAVFELPIAITEVSDFKLLEEN